MANPFIAARIPEDLNAALDAFAQASGASRSAVVLDALRAYLGAEKPGFDLEARVQRLEEAVLSLQPANPRICIDCGADFFASDGMLCEPCRLGPVDDNQFLEGLSSRASGIGDLQQLSLMGAD